MGAGAPMPLGRPIGGRQLSMILPLLSHIQAKAAIRGLPTQRAIARFKMLVD